MTLIFPSSTGNAPNNKNVSTKQNEVLSPEEVFTVLRNYLSEHLNVALDEINLESTVFFGEYNLSSIRPISSGSLSSAQNYDAPENSLGMDTMDGIELIMFLEEEFDIEINESCEVQYDVVTIQKLISLIIEFQHIQNQ